jgi:hypothetical protein
MHLAFPIFPHNLNLSNRRMRTRTSGGVGGEPLDNSHGPLSRSAKRWTDDRIRLGLCCTVFASTGPEARLSLGALMSKNHNRTVLLLALSLSTLSACNKDQPLGVSENRTVTTFGGTCGRWQTTNPKTGVVTFVVATCGPGLECFPGAWKVASPDGDKLGRDFEICLPPGSTCSADAKCPAPLGCASGYGVDSGAACLLKCQTNADCPDEFQICDGSCEFAMCPRPGETGVPDYCPTDSHCQDGSCRTGSN